MITLACVHLLRFGSRAVPESHARAHEFLDAVTCGRLMSRMDDAHAAARPPAKESRIALTSAELLAAVGAAQHARCELPRRRCRAVAIVRPVCGAGLLPPRKAPACANPLLAPCSWHARCGGGPGELTPKPPTAWVFGCTLCASAGSRSSSRSRWPARGSSFGAWRHGARAMTAWLSTWTTPASSCRCRSTRTRSKPPLPPCHCSLDYVWSRAGRCTQGHCLGSLWAQGSCSSTHARVRPRVVLVWQPGPRHCVPLPTPPCVLVDQRGCGASGTLMFSSAWTCVCARACVCICVRVRRQVRRWPARLCRCRWLARAAPPRGVRHRPHAPHRPRRHGPDTRHALRPLRGVDADPPLKERRVAEVQRLRHPQRGTRSPRPRTTTLFSRGGLGGGSACTVETRAGP